MFTHDMSDPKPRYVIRGYFTGDGQHWTAVWDRTEDRYVSYPGQNVPALFRSSADAEGYLSFKAEG